MAALARDLDRQALVTRNEFKAQRYPALGQNRTRYWANLLTLFDAPEDIHMVIDTTNAIESLNRVICEAVETERCFHRTRRC